MFTASEYTSRMCDWQKHASFLSHFLSITWSIGFLKTKGVKLPDKEQLEKVLGINNQIKVSFPPALPVRDRNWILPDLIQEQDFIVYSLALPMSAADLLWIKNIPTDQPAWLMVASKESTDWSDERNALEAQLPDRWTNRVLKWNGSQTEMATVLSPIKKLLENPKKNADIMQCTSIHAYTYDAHTLNTHVFSYALFIKLSYFNGARAS